MTITYYAIRTTSGNGDVRYRSTSTDLASTEADLEAFKGVRAELVTLTMTTTGWEPVK